VTHQQYDFTEVLTYAKFHLYARFPGADTVGTRADLHIHSGTNLLSGLLG
jgi:hypothetical protein